MKNSKNIRTLSGPGDLPTAPMKSEGLGLIEEIVQAAGAITALLINVLKSPPSDAWSTYTTYDKKRFVKQALEVSTTAALTNSAFSVANAFRKFIARVDLNQDWSKWQTHNSEFLVSLYQAEDEVKQYRSSGYNPYMEYVNPQIINRVMHPNPAKASISGNSLVIMLLFAMGGAAFVYKKFIFPVETGKKLN